MCRLRVRFVGFAPVYPLIGLAERAKITFNLFYKREDEAFLRFSRVTARRTIGTYRGKSTVEAIYVLSTHALGNPRIFLRQQAHLVLSSLYGGRTREPALGRFSDAPGE